MQEVVLVIHLILAVTIIGLVLLQRSSGGGLGTGGSGLGDFATARGAASAISRATMICAFLFFTTSIALALIAKHDTGNKGLLANVPTAEAPVMPDAPEGAAAPAADAAAPNTEAPAEAPAPATPEPPISTQ